MLSKMFVLDSKVLLFHILLHLQRSTFPYAAGILDTMVTRHDFYWDTVNYYTVELRTLMK